MEEEGVDLQVRFIEGGTDLDLLAEEASEDGHEVGDRLPQLEDGGLEHLTAAEGEQPAREPGRAVGQI